MKEWQIKYKYDGDKYTEIYECDSEKAYDVWKRFQEEQKDIIYLEDIRKI